MKLEFDYESKTVTIKGKCNLNELKEALVGKEDWEILQEAQVVKEYINNWWYNPYRPIGQWNPFTYSGTSAANTATTSGGDTSISYSIN